MAFPRSSAWLSTTPEPERLLPGAVAALAANGRPAAAAIERERERLEHAIRGARLRAWRAYLRRAQALASRRDPSGDPEVARARELTRALLADHENLMAGITPRR